MKGEKKLIKEKRLQKNLINPKYQELNKNFWIGKIKDDPRLRVYFPEHWFAPKGKCGKEYIINVYAVLEP